MDEVTGMSERRRRAGLVEHSDPARRSSTGIASGLNLLRQGLAVDQLHDEERPAARHFAQVVYRHDRRVLDPADVKGLLDETVPWPRRP